MKYNTSLFFFILSLISSCSPMDSARLQKISLDLNEIAISRWSIERDAASIKRRYNKLAISEENVNNLLLKRKFLLDELLSMAETGNPEALLILGQAYEKGSYGLDRDLTMAYQFYRDCAMQFSKEKSSPLIQKQKNTCTQGATRTR